jgi:hypothetical protein
VPAYPRASNQQGSNTRRERAVGAWQGTPGSDHEGEDQGVAEAVREQLRALIIEELKHLMKA